MLEVVNNVEIEVVSYEETFMVSNEEVSKAYGVSESNIRSHKSNGEFKKGVHYIDSNSGKGQTKTMWTKKGIITLGFRLRETEFTTAFRDWASDYIINGGEVAKPLSYEQVMQQALTMADDKVKALQGANNLLVDKNERLYDQVEDVKEELRERDNLDEHISNRSESIPIGDWAKAIYDLHGVQIGQNILFRILRETGYLFMRSNKKNTVHQRYLDQRLFKLKDASYVDRRTGEKIFELKVEVTYKGMNKLTDIIISHYSDE